MKSSFPKLYVGRGHLAATTLYDRMGRFVTIPDHDFEQEALPHADAVDRRHAVVQCNDFNPGWWRRSDFRLLVKVG
ncbi:MAG TPA: hypothetical protein VHC94_12545 [Nitrobacter sp.]|nr:hypothetical protein [Nitrobacter sp.]